MSHSTRISFTRLLAIPALALVLAPAMYAADAKGEALFKEKVWPIIDSTCVGCHGEKKQKGKLRLDSKEAWLKGGEEGQIVTPGDPEKSGVMVSIKYEHKDTDKNMPPKKEKKLSAEQVALIGEWIKAGMPWPAAK